MRPDLRRAGDRHWNLHNVVRHRFRQRSRVGEAMHLCTRCGGTDDVDKRGNARMQEKGSGWNSQGLTNHRQGARSESR